MSEGQGAPPGAPATPYLTSWHRELVEAIENTDGWQTSIDEEPNAEWVPFGPAHYLSMQLVEGAAHWYETAAESVSWLLTERDDQGIVTFSLHPSHTRAGEWVTKTPQGKPERLVYLIDGREMQPKVVTTVVWLERVCLGTGPCSTHTHQEMTHL